MSLQSNFRFPFPFPLPFFPLSSNSGPAGLLTLGNLSLPSRNAAVYSSCASSSSSSSPKGVSLGMNKGVAYLPLAPLTFPSGSGVSPNGVTLPATLGVELPPRLEFGIEVDRVALRILGEGVIDSREDGLGASDNALEEYREREAYVPPDPKRDLDREAAILALLELRREEGGAYSEAGRGG